MSEEAPIGELAIRTQAMPADTNPSGDIFGGWVLSQMDMVCMTWREMHGNGVKIGMTATKTPRCCGVVIGTSRLTTCA